MSTSNVDDLKNVLRNLKYALKLDSDKEVADYLGVSGQVLSNWLMRGSDKAKLVIRDKLKGRDDIDLIMSGEDYLELAVEKKEPHLSDTAQRNKQKIIKAFTQLSEAAQYESVAYLIRKAEEEKKRNDHEA